MSITVQPLTTGGSTTDGTSYNTAAFAPEPNELVLVEIQSALAAMTGAVDPTLSGGGLTGWAQLGSRIGDGTDVHHHHLYAASSASPGAAAALNILWAANRTYCHWQVARFAGVDLSGGIAAAIAQHLTAVQAGVDPITPVAYGAFGHRENIAYGAVGSPNSRTYTPGTGYALLGQTGSGSGGQGSLAAERALVNKSQLEMDLSASSTALIRALELVAAQYVDTPTAVLEAEFTADATGHTTELFNVTAGRLYIIAVLNRVAAGTAPTPTLSASNGDVPTPITSPATASILSNGSNLNRLTFYAWVPSTTGDVTLTTAYGGTTITTAGITVDQFPGASTSGPNGVDAIAQVKMANSAFSTNPLATLDAAPAADSWTWGADCSNTAAGNVAPTASWTELSETAQIEATFPVATLYKIGSQTASWATTNVAWFAGALEIRRQKSALIRAGWRSRYPRLRAA